LSTTRPRTNHATDDGKRKFIGLAARAALGGTAALWSIDTFVKPKATAHVQATETSPPFSPIELTVKQAKMVPVEYFAHPF
jgi:hypothetical protein